MTFEPNSSKLEATRLMCYRCSSLLHRKLMRVFHAVLGVYSKCGLSFVLHRTRWNYVLVCLAVCSPTRGKFHNRRRALILLLHRFRSLKELQRFKLRLTWLISSGFSLYSQTYLDCILRIIGFRHVQSRRLLPTSGMNRMPPSSG